MATSDFQPIEPTDAPRELGVEDIDGAELKTLCSRICHVVPRDLSKTVNEIFIMGSFARGEARKVFSDLDLRVIVTGYTPENERRPVEESIKCNDGPNITPSVCGYLDVHITTLHPTAEEPSVSIYTRD